MKCDSCGHEYDSDAKFCNVCGKRIVAARPNVDAEEPGTGTFHEGEAELGLKEEPAYFHADSLNLSLSKRVFWSWLVLAVLFTIPVILVVYIAGWKNGALCLSSLMVLGVALALLLVMMNRGEL
ncbi:MAG TPA: zinc ribbon domain-containing protein [Thermoplasmata archaeon]|nr:zinc ribbon domain-containing protein [Thermoplasmata archaeon]